jgi:hypothetical protein
MDIFGYELDLSLFVTIAVCSWNALSAIKNMSKYQKLKTLEFKLQTEEIRLKLLENLLDARARDLGVYSTTNRVPRSRKERVAEKLRNLGRNTDNEHEAKLALEMAKEIGYK